METFSWQPFILSLELAFLSTLLLVMVGVPLAYWIAHSRSRFKFLLDALVSLPLVLPPSVLGFYFLVLFSPNGALGEFLKYRLGVSLVFSFEGLVVATFLFSLPFLVNPVKTGFESLPEYFQEVSEILNKSRWTVFWKVQLPNLKLSLLTGASMGFAHSMGAFGFILMIGGNIPGKTRVASVAIYNAMEGLDYEAAHINSLILLCVSFLILSMVHYLKKRVWEV